MIFPSEKLISSINRLFERRNSYQIKKGALDISYSKKSRLHVAIDAR